MTDSQDPLDQRPILVVLEESLRNNKPLEPLYVARAFLKLQEQGQLLNELLLCEAFLRGHVLTYLRDVAACSFDEELQGLEARAQELLDKMAKLFPQLFPAEQA
jgi:hypothetical protein